METTVSINCEFCRTPKEVTLGKLNHSHKLGRPIFCSVECARASRKEKSNIFFDCKYCGKTVTIKRWQLKQRQQQNGSTNLYCSHKCHYKDARQSIELPCNYCGKILQRRRYEISRNVSECVYCDHHCSRKDVGRTRFIAKGESVRLKQLRHQCRERDDYRCRAKGCESPAIETHHIIPVTRFENVSDAHTLGNLITLCKPCHLRADARLRTIFMQMDADARLRKSLDNSK